MSTFDYWLDLAEYDLGTGIAMLKTKRYLYVGFMCQQVIEKALKAYFVKLKDRHPPYTHKLALLFEECELADELTEEQLDLVDELEPLNIEARYPKYKQDLLSYLTADKSEELLQQTRVLFEWIKSRLSKF